MEGIGRSPSDRQLTTSRQPRSLMYVDVDWREDIRPSVERAAGMRERARGGRGEQRRRRGRKAFKNRLPPFVRSFELFGEELPLGERDRRLEGCVPPACLPGWPTDWGRRESETRTPAAAKVETEAPGRLGCRLPRAGIRRTADDALSTAAD